MSGRRPPAEPQRDSAVFPGIFFRSRDNDGGKQGSGRGEPAAGSIHIENVQTGAMRSAEPINMVCPFCQKHMDTEVIFETGMGAWLVACLICISGCCCFAWIPFMGNFMKDAVHQCSVCHREVGRYIRLHSHRAPRRRRRRTARDPSQKSSSASQKSSSASQKSSSASWHQSSQTSSKNSRQNSRQDSGFFNWPGRNESERSQSGGKRQDSGFFSWGGRNESERSQAGGKRRQTQSERRNPQKQTLSERFSLW